MASKRELRNSIEELEELEDRVSELETQLEENLVEKSVYDPDYLLYNLSPWGPRPPKIKVHELTIEGKVNAILEHLGVDVTVQQKKTTTTGPKVKVVKVKKGKK